MALVQTSMCSRGMLTGQSIAKSHDDLGIWDRKSRILVEVKILPHVKRAVVVDALKPQHGVWIVF